MFRLVEHVKVTPEPEVSQQNVAQSFTPSLPVCLLPIVHPGPLFSPDNTQTHTQSYPAAPHLTWPLKVCLAVYKSRHEHSDQSAATLCIDTFLS